MKLPIVAVALVIGALSTSGPAQASPADPARAVPPAGGGPRTGGDTHDVTLVTGDRLEVTTGAHPTARVLQSTPGTTAYASFAAGPAYYVIPDQALPLIAGGRVDQKLFDVTGLVAQGYDDAASPSLPVIVEYGSAGLVPHAAPAGARVGRSLPSVHGVAAEVAKPDAQRFWHSLVGAGPALTASPTQVWLDAQVHTDADANITQIGAPAAWQRGFDGTGVKIAVLDSGIDTSHPDLANRVVAADNFTDEADTDDYVGHGTHVASIAAGASEAHGGVAHGARLLNGKVMQLGFTGPGVPEGVGRESWILAGMQWAVDQGARIVNMSLGNTYPDGNDPLSRAVNALTAQSGVLFVVSAGNSGPEHYSVGGPAAADAALAVGSVDADDSISVFSSRGPRMIDGALKPEVTAPGNGIVAARAAHGRIGVPAGDGYVRLSGTSMAAPHVAGAAAILLQQHPDWHAAELRAALTSTASYNPSVDAYSQGGGRIDVDRATRQSVFAGAGTVNAGYFAANARVQASTTMLTYRNTSDAAATLTLSAQATTQTADPAPAGTLTVSPSTLTVPAHGTATASVQVNVAGRPVGAYNGRITATGADGLALGTTVGFVKQGAEVQPTFRAIDRNGRPSEAFLILRSPRVPNAFLPVSVPAGGSATVQLDAGDYSLLGYVRTPFGSTDANAALTVVADPDLDVAQPNPTITYDARKAQPFDVKVPRDVDVNGLAVGLQTERPGLNPPIQDSLLFARGPSYGSVPKVPMSVLPFDRPRHGHGELDSYWSLVSPRARASVVSPHRDVTVALMDGSARLDMSAELPLMDLGDGTAADFAGVSLTGKLALVRQNSTVSVDDQAAAASQAGATALVVSSAQPGPYYDTANSDIPVLAISQADGDLLRGLLGRHGVRIHLSGHSSSSYLYDLAFREHDRVGNTVYRPYDLAEVRTAYYADDSRTQQRFWQNRNPNFDTICGYCSTSAREGEDWHGAVTRTEYVTADVPWRESLLQDGWLQWAAVRSYPRGVTHASWAKAPVVPGVPIQGGPASTRVGDQLQLRLAGFTDSEPTHAAPEPYWWFQGTTALSRNGEALGECRTFYMLNCDVTVPDDPATYTLAVDDPAPIFSDAAQSSKTTWTFHSQAGEATLPLIDVDYDLPVSPTNTVRAGTWTSLHLGIARQPGATGGRLNAPSVQVSYDDGTTWVDARVAASGHGRYRVSYRLPPRSATNGFVALRVSASDAGGDAITQEVKRAYRLTS